MNRVIMIVLVLMVVAAIAYAQTNTSGENPAGPFGGMPRMGQMMPMMPMGNAIMQISGDNIYILRGEQLIKLSNDLKVIKQVTLPRPAMPTNRSSGGSQEEQ